MCFLLGWIYLFFASLPWLGVTVALLCFLMIILVDNVFCAAQMAGGFAERLGGGVGAGLWQYRRAFLVAVRK